MGRVFLRFRDFWGLSVRTLGIGVAVAVVEALRPSKDRRSLGACPVRSARSSARLACLGFRVDRRLGELLVTELCTCSEGGGVGKGK